MTRTVGDLAYGALNPGGDKLGGLLFLPKSAQLLVQKIHGLSGQARALQFAAFPGTDIPVTRELGGLLFPPKKRPGDKR